MRYATQEYHQRQTDIEGLQNAVKKFKTWSNIEKRMKAKGKDATNATKKRQEAERRLLQIRRGI